MINKHYPYVTKKLLELWDEGLLSNVAAVEVEPEYGYAARIRYHDGSVRLTYGNDVGLNSRAACEVAKDKAHTKYFLRNAGFNCPQGESFLMPWWAARIMPVLTAQGFADPRTVDDAIPYARELGFPVYVKPVDGARGEGVWRCHDAAQINDAIAKYAEEWVRVVLIEEAIDLPDHRLVVLHGRLISAYSRFPLAVTGDGASTIGALFTRLQRMLTQKHPGIRIDLEDIRIKNRLTRLGRDFASVPTAGETVTLHDISNLSAGGTARDVTSMINPRWTELALDVAAGLGLDFCGIDLACADITDPEGDYFIFEVNAIPGLDHYGSVGAEQETLVKELYAAVLNEPT